MGKYDPLAAFLRKQRGAEVSLTFREIERIVGGILPKASTRPEWWAAEDTPGAPQIRAWKAVRFSPRVDFRAERVTFEREVETPPTRD